MISHLTSFPKKVRIAEWSYLGDRQKRYPAVTYAAFEYQGRLF